MRIPIEITPITSQSQNAIQRSPSTTEFIHPHNEPVTLEKKENAIDDLSKLNAQQLDDFFSNRGVKVGNYQQYLKFLHMLKTYHIEYFSQIEISFKKIMSLCKGHLSDALKIPGLYFLLTIKINQYFLKNFKTFETFSLYSEAIPTLLNRPFSFANTLTEEAVLKYVKICKPGEIKNLAQFMLMPCSLLSKEHIQCLVSHTMLTVGQKPIDYKKLLSQLTFFWCGHPQHQLKVYEFFDFLADANQYIEPLCEMLEKLNFVSNEYRDENAIISTVFIRQLRLDSQKAGKKSGIYLKELLNNNQHLLLTANKHLSQLGIIYNIIILHSLLPIPELSTVTFDPFAKENLAALEFLDKLFIQYIKNTNKSNTRSKQEDIIYDFQLFIYMLFIGSNTKPSSSQNIKPIVNKELDDQTFSNQYATRYSDTLNKLFIALEKLNNSDNLQRVLLNHPSLFRIMIQLPDNNLNLDKLIEISNNIEKAHQFAAINPENPAHAQHLAELYQSIRQHELVIKYALCAINKSHNKAENYYYCAQASMNLKLYTQDPKLINSHITIAKQYIAKALVESPLNQRYLNFQNFIIKEESVPNPSENDSVLSGSSVLKSESTKMEGNTVLLHTDLRKISCNIIAPSEKISTNTQIEEIIPECKVNKIQFDKKALIFFQQLFAPYLTSQWQLTEQRFLTNQMSTKSETEIIQILNQHLLQTSDYSMCSIQTSPELSKAIQEFSAHSIKLLEQHFNNQAKIELKESILTIKPLLIIDIDKINTKTLSDQLIKQFLNPLPQYQLVTFAIVLDEQAKNAKKRIDEIKNNLQKFIDAITLKFHTDNIYNISALLPKRTYNTNRLQSLQTRILDNINYIQTILNKLQNSYDDDLPFNQYEVALKQFYADISTIKLQECEETMKKLSAQVNTLELTCHDGYKLVTECEQRIVKINELIKQFNEALIQCDEQINSHKQAKMDYAESFTDKQNYPSNPKNTVKKDTEIKKPQEKEKTKLTAISLDPPAKELKPKATLPVNTSYLTPSVEKPLAVTSTTIIINHIGKEFKPLIKHVDDLKLTSVQSTHNKTKPPITKSEISAITLIQRLKQHHIIYLEDYVSHLESHLMNEKKQQVNCTLANLTIDNMILSEAMTHQLFVINHQILLVLLYLESTHIKESHFLAKKLNHLINVFRKFRNMLCHLPDQFEIINLIESTKLFIFAENIAKLADLMKLLSEQNIDKNRACNLIDTLILSIEKLPLYHILNKEWDNKENLLDKYINNPTLCLLHIGHLMQKIHAVSKIFEQFMLPLNNYPDRKDALKMLMQKMRVTLELLSTDTLKKITTSSLFLQCCEKLSHNPKDTLESDGHLNIMFYFNYCKKFGKPISHTGEKQDNELPESLLLKMAFFTQKLLPLTESFFNNANQYINMPSPPPIEHTPQTNISIFTSRLNPNATPFIPTPKSNNNKVQMPPNKSEQKDVSIEAKAIDEEKSATSKLSAIMQSNTHLHTH